ncbi:hypothetical protein [Nonomuraea guangzhouensis]|uniref:Helix-turn-helix domain-containing protein n=1 Tax=Nonomuraea guangzhouensis TaxID=1291555 RepID=A0ABW4GYL3_9ACTN|nr:hypothetical protein [Nonomuraea guangzhouensis]
MPDPDDPDVVTLWWATSRRFSAWPLGHRWAPFPPPAPAGLDPAERGAWRQEWYDRVYFPWKERVIDAIADDPAAAAALFDERVPPADRPTVDALPRSRPSVFPRRRKRRSAPGGGKLAARRDKAAREAFLAASLDDEGSTVDGIASALGLPRTTAWRRLKAGQAQYGAALATLRALRSRPDPFTLAADHFGEDPNMVDGGER